MILCSLLVCSDASRQAYEVTGPHGVHRMDVCIFGQNQGNFVQLISTSWDFKILFECALPISLLGLTRNVGLELSCFLNIPKADIRTFKVTR